MSEEIEKKLYLETRVTLHDLRDKIGTVKYMAILMTEASHILSYLSEIEIEGTINRLEESAAIFKEAREKKRN